PKTKTRNVSNPVARRLRWLSQHLAYKVQGPSAMKGCATCSHEHIGTPRSWIAFFRVVTNEAQLRELDSWTRMVVAEHIYKKYKFRLKHKHFKLYKFRNLVDEFYRVRQIRLKPCKCDLEEQGLWYFTPDLYHKRYFHTPAQHKPFRVATVMQGGI